MEYSKINDKFNLFEGIDDDQLVELIEWGHSPEYSTVNTILDNLKISRVNRVLSSKTDGLEELSEIRGMWASFAKFLSLPDLAKKELDKRSSLQSKVKV